MRVNADAMTLYAVTDRTWVKDTTLMDQVKEALEGGITFLQLREKHLSKEEFIKEAREMKELSKMCIRDRLCDQSDQWSKSTNLVIRLCTCRLRYRSDHVCTSA